MRMPPPLPRSHHYKENIESYQIIQYSLTHDHCGMPSRICAKALYSSSSARMVYRMLCAMKKHNQLDTRHEIHVVYEGKLYGMLIYQFINMIHSSYITHDDGHDSPITEWIEIHEQQRYANTLIYCGTWYECYREVAKWTPERRQQVHVLVMRQQRPRSDYNRPYIEHAYPNADEFWQDYDNWTALMTYDKHADYYPILSEPDAA